MTSTVVYLQQPVTQPPVDPPPVDPPDAGDGTGAFVGGSTGTLGDRLGDMWGGPQSGSWLTTKLPPNTAVHPDSALSVNDLVSNTTGTSNRTGNPAYPWINFTNYGQSINVVPRGTPRVPVTLVGNRVSQNPTMAKMFAAGVPIPDGIEPTGGSDATLVIVYPDWEFPGNKALGLNIVGQYYDLWAAKTPDQNEAIGRGRIWTCAGGGRIPGCVSGARSEQLHGYAYNDWWTAAASWVPSGSGIDPAEYRYGPDGVGCGSNWAASASHINLTHLAVTKRDLTRRDPETGWMGYIDHPVGYMLDPVMPENQAPNVWPAQSWDGASAKWHQNGTRHRLKASYQIPDGIPDVDKAFQKAMRDYGIVLVDTALSGGLTIRSEAACASIIGSPVAFMRRQPWGQMERIAQGTAANPNPVT